MSGTTPSSGSVVSPRDVPVSDDGSRSTGMRLSWAVLVSGLLGLLGGAPLVAAVAVVALAVGWWTARRDVGRAVVVPARREVERGSTVPMWVRVPGARVTTVVTASLHGVPSAVEPGGRVRLEAGAWSSGWRTSVLLSVAGQGWTGLFAPVRTEAVALADDVLVLPVASPVDVVDPVVERPGPAAGATTGERPVPSTSTLGPGDALHLRPWRNEDGPRAVDWRATARVGQLVARTRERPADVRPRVVLRLDLPVLPDDHPPFAHADDRCPVSVREVLLGQALSTVRAWRRRGWDVVLATHELATPDASEPRALVGLVRSDAELRRRLARTVFGPGPDLAGTATADAAMHMGPVVGPARADHEDDVARPADGVGETTPSGRDLVVHAAHGAGLDDVPGGVPRAVRTSLARVRKLVQARALAAVFVVVPAVVGAMGAGTESTAGSVLLLLGGVAGAVQLASQHHDRRFDVGGFVTVASATLLLVAAAMVGDVPGPFVVLAGAVVVAVFWLDAQSTLCDDLSGAPRPDALVGPALALAALLAAGRVGLAAGGVAMLATWAFVVLRTRPAVQADVAVATHGLAASLVLVAATGLAGASGLAGWLAAAALAAALVASRPASPLRHARVTSSAATAPTADGAADRGHAAATTAICVAVLGLAVAVLPLLLVLLGAQFDLDGGRSSLPAPTATEGAWEGVGGELDATRPPPLGDLADGQVLGWIEAVDTTHWRERTYVDWDGRTWSSGADRMPDAGRGGGTTGVVETALTAAVELRTPFGPPQVAGAVVVEDAGGPAEREVELPTPGVAGAPVVGGLRSGDTLWMWSVPPDGEPAALAAVDPYRGRGDEALVRAGLTPRVAAEVERVAGHLDRPLDRVEALTAWLGDQVVYDRDVQALAASEDPIATFLFDTRRGWCTPVATTLTLALRHLGTPARLATGFVAVEPAGEAGTWVVRSSHYHAWTEVWFDGVGWVPFDPTSGVANDEASDGGQPPWLLPTVLGLVLAAAGIAWLRWPGGGRDRSGLHGAPRHDGPGVAERTVARAWADRADAALRRIAAAVDLPRRDGEGVVAHTGRMVGAGCPSGLDDVARAVERAAYGPVPPDAETMDAADRALAAALAGRAG